MKLDKMKICNQCNESLPNNPEYFYRSKLCKDGLERKCKKCRNIHTRKYTKKHYEKILKYQNGLHDRNKLKNKNKIFDPKKLLECTHCHKAFPMIPKYFYRNNGQKRGLAQPCKECRYKYELRKRLLDGYNISTEEYMIIYNKQSGKCSICGKVENTVKRGRKIKLSVDHSHITGNIRGLLCIRCNSGIGMFHDDIELIKKAIKYLEETK